MNEVKIWIDVVYCLFIGGQNIGVEFFQFFQIVFGMEQKYVVVLVVIVVGDVGLSGFQFWFFNELCYFKSYCICCVWYDIIMLDIVIVGFWQIWYDIEGYQFVCVGIGYGVVYCVVEGFFIGDCMICCQYQYQWIVVCMLVCCCQCCQCNCWCGIVFGGFKNNVFCQFIELVELFGNDKMVLFVIDYYWVFVFYVVQMVNGGLQYGEIVFQVQKLFWIKYVRKWL